MDTAAYAVYSSANDPAATGRLASDLGGVLDIVLGVSMAPSTIRMVLLEGENADGVTVDEDQFDVVVGDDPATLSAPDQVIAAILGTREGAIAAGHQLQSTGVTWTHPGDAAELAAALAARKVENVMLVSAFLSAAALAQTVGQAIGYEQTTLLFIESDSATLAFVDSNDGSVTDVQRRPLPHSDRIAELARLIDGLDAAEACLEGLFIVGCGVDIVPIKPALEAVSSLPISAPEEPETALARGAALASANAPLFASSTAALAYAQDPGTGEVDPYAVSPGYLDVPVPSGGATLREHDLAYSAVPDDEANADTGVVDVVDADAADDLDDGHRRRPLVLVGSGLAAVFVSAALALEIALALGIRPAVALRPVPGEALIAPVGRAPSPSATQLIRAPRPQALQLPARLAPPAMHVPAPAPIAHVPVPVAPVPVPVPLHAMVPAPPVHVPYNSFGQLPNLNMPQLPSQGMPWQGSPSQGSPWQGSPSQRSPWRGRHEPTSPQRGFGSPPRMNYPAPEGPRFPGAPGGGFPRPMMPGPMRPPMPMMPSMPSMPHFNFGAPRFRF
jgi:hypothetical protein